MTRHETVDANTQKPHLWPDRAPMLSRRAKELVGKRISWLINGLGRSAQLGPDGYAAFDRGNFHWGKNSLSWELRTYDQHQLYRDFDNRVDDDNIRVIFVLTAQEALENLAQQQARLAALRALHWPPKTCPEYKGKHAFRSKKRAAG